jgi:hypothetical protein
MVNRRVMNLRRCLMSMGVVGRRSRSHVLKGALRALPGGGAEGVEEMGRNGICQEGKDMWRHDDSDGSKSA